MRARQPEAIGHFLRSGYGPAEVTAKPERLRRRPSFDSITGGYPNVDLHVVDVPYGSLSRAQVALQASTAGWLTTAVAATDFESRPCVRIQRP